MNYITNQFFVFLQFLWRDFFVYYKKLWDFLINYMILAPILYTILFGIMYPTFIIPNITPRATTLLYVGSLLLFTFSLTFQLTYEILLDWENDRFMAYQMSIINPRLLIVQRIIFAGLFTFILLIPFFPISKLLMQSQLDVSNTNWVKLIICLFFGSMCIASYMVCAMCFMTKSLQTTQFWTRCNIPLLDFGGLWMNWQKFRLFSQPLALVMLANPLICFTEGMRQAIVGGKEFFPFWISIGGMICFTVLFTFGAWHYFKKKTDHI